jgi:transposase
MDGKDLIAHQNETIAQLQAILQRQAEQIHLLTERIARLEDENARLKRNSSKSSKPPSSDIVKPPAPTLRRKGKRKRGGQRGHRKHQRSSFPPEQVDQIVTHELPHTQGLDPLDDWRIVQQVELVERPFMVVEHRCRRYCCRRTGRIVTAPLPPAVGHAGLLGPRLSALAAYQKGACHMSYKTIRAFFRDVLGIPISTGQLAKVVAKASASLADAYEELADALPNEASIGVDETGHKDSGLSHWTWCFRAGEFTWYKIDPSRGSQVLRAVLGETFGGVLGCDFFSAYRKYMADSGATVQFCLAHLIREVRFLAESGEKVLKNWANQLLGHLRTLFKTLHRQAKLPAATFALAMDAARRAFLRQVCRPPSRAEAHTLADRFRKHGKSYFTFLTRPGVEPTNNLTEQAIRHVVIDRKVTQGTRGSAGQRWCERIWTLLSTCRRQGRSAFRFLVECLTAHFQHQPAPSLLHVEP